MALDVLLLNGTCLTTSVADINIMFAFLVLLQKTVSEETNQNMFLGMLQYDVPGCKTQCHGHTKSLVASFHLESRLSSCLAKSFQVASDVARLKHETSVRLNEGHQP